MMRISKGMQEDGIVVGNTYDKYGSRNPVVRSIMHGFTSALASLVARAAPASIHEIGCGEGYWVLEWNRMGIDARGSDFSAAVIELARENAGSAGLPADKFGVRSIYDMQAGRDSADLIVCCEVLEHLADPAAGLAALRRIATDQVILSVPREPIWRALNMLRGKYLGDLGNTPGHIQHWSSSEFVDLAGRYFDVIEVKTPLPWTMLHCRVPS